MSSHRDVFKVSGPIHVTNINWNCPHYQRSVVASLVQGTYVLEADRQQKRRGSEARAPAWWNSFHFTITGDLIDDADRSIFGAIFEFKHPKDHSPVNAPKFVIAFRGTLMKKGSIFQDFKLDFDIVKSSLDQSSRFRTAMQAVQNLVSTVGCKNIWLAGHSLGSSIATLAGKGMAKLGIHLKTFLFNPPFVCPPIEMIKDENLKTGTRIVNNFLKAGLAMAVNGRHEKSDDDPFEMLSTWVPHLFVNRSDLVCAEYIGYFETRKKMEEIGVGNVGKMAARNSLRGLLFGQQNEMVHLLPSGNLTINSSTAPNFIAAHGIEQWWSTDESLQTEEYRYE